MVSRKRDVLATPGSEPRVVQNKKFKGYSMQAPNTPLRNVMTPEQHTGDVIQSASRRPAAEIVGALAGSASRSRLASTSIEALKEDSSEPLSRKEELIQKRRSRKDNLMSPVVGSSPRAAPPQTLSGSKAIRKKEGAAAGNTPVASVIAGEIANRPLPGSNGKPKMTAEQMNRVFEEWIKIAADNKITSKNTWTVALIDYFSELSFVRDGTSINFQKASCTLDGCVKVYASRVDSVVDETSKLLNGMSDGSFKSGKQSKDDAGYDGDEGQEEEEVLRKKQYKKANRHVNTLEKNAEALNLKQFDLEYSVDPLFRKTCAEFDESHSRGTLLHNLGFSSSCQVVLDSADSERVLDSSASAPAGSEAMVSLASLKSQFTAELSSVRERKLCAPFADYSLSDDQKGSNFAEDQMAKALDRMSKLTIQPIIEQPPTKPTSQDKMEVDGQVFDAPPALDDNFEGAAFDANDYAPFMDDDYGADMGGGASFDDEHYSEGIEHHHLVENADAEASGPGFTRNTDLAANIFSYFDDSWKQQSWAGPNHWKVRRPALSRSNTASKRQVSKKKDFVLEFDESANVDIDALFSKPASLNTITLSRTQIEERSLKDNLLPEDLHFSSLNFLRLFIKPSWRFGANVPTPASRFNMWPAQQQRLNAAHIEAPAQVEGRSNDATEIRTEFWAKADAYPEGVADVLYDPDMNPENFPIDDDYGAGPSPDSDYDDEPAATATLSQEPVKTLLTFGADLVALKAGVQVQRLAFSRVAKRVDVHKLKQAIWEEIEEEKKPKEKEAIGGAAKLSQLIGQLGETKASYPKEALKDVSVSYCFICLLHLANEHGLVLEADGSDVIVQQAP